MATRPRADSEAPANANTGWSPSDDEGVEPLSQGEIQGMLTGFDKLSWDVQVKTMQRFRRALMTPQGKTAAGQNIRHLVTLMLASANNLRSMVASASLQTINAMALALGSKLDQDLPTIIPVLLSKLAESSKVFLSSDALGALAALISRCTSRKVVSALLQCRDPKSSNKQKGIAWALYQMLLHHGDAIISHLPRPLTITAYQRMLASATASAAANASNYSQGSLLPPGTPRSGRSRSPSKHSREPSFGGNFLGINSFNAGPGPSPTASSIASWDSLTTPRSRGTSIGGEGESKSALPVLATPSGQSKHLTLVSIVSALAILAEDRNADARLWTARALLLLHGILSPISAKNLALPPLPYAPPQSAQYANLGMTVGLDGGPAFIDGSSQDNPTLPMSSLDAVITICVGETAANSAFGAPSLQLSSSALPSVSHSFSTSSMHLALSTSPYATSTSTPAGGLIQSSISTALLATHRLLSSRDWTGELQSVMRDREEVNPDGAHAAEASAEAAAARLAAIAQQRSRMKYLNSLGAGDGLNGDGDDSSIGNESSSPSVNRTRGQRTHSRSSSSLIGGRSRASSRADEDGGGGNFLSVGGARVTTTDGKRTPQEQRSARRWTPQTPGAFQEEDEDRLGNVSMNLGSALRSAGDEIMNSGGNGSGSGSGIGATIAMAKRGQLGGSPSFHARTVSAPDLKDSTSPLRNNRGTPIRRNSLRGGDDGNTNHDNGDDDDDDDALRRELYADDDVNEGGVGGAGEGDDAEPGLSYLELYRRSLPSSHPDALPPIPQTTSSSNPGDRTPRITRAISDASVPSSTSTQAHSHTNTTDSRDITQTTTLGNTPGVQSSRDALVIPKLDLGGAASCRSISTNAPPTDGPEVGSTTSSSQSISSNTLPEPPGSAGGSASSRLRLLRSRANRSAGSMFPTAGEANHGLVGGVLGGTRFGSNGNTGDGSSPISPSTTSTAPTTSPNLMSSPSEVGDLVYQQQRAGSGSSTGTTATEGERSSLSTSSPPTTTPSATPPTSSSGLDVSNGTPTRSASRQRLALLAAKLHQHQGSGTGSGSFSSRSGTPTNTLPQQPDQQHHQQQQQQHHHHGTSAIDRNDDILSQAVASHNHSTHPLHSSPYPSTSTSSNPPTPQLMAKRPFILRAGTHLPPSQQQLAMGGSSTGAPYGFGSSPNAEYQGRNSNPSVRETRAFTYDAADASSYTYNANESGNGGPSIGPGYNTNATQGGHPGPNRSEIIPPQSGSAASKLRLLRLNANRPNTSGSTTGLVNSTSSGVLASDLTTRDLDGTYSYPPPRRSMTEGDLNSNQDTSRAAVGRSSPLGEDRNGGSNFIDRNNNSNHNTAGDGTDAGQPRISRFLKHLVRDTTTTE